VKYLKKSVVTLSKEDFQYAVIKASTDLKGIGYRFVEASGGENEHIVHLLKQMLRDPAEMLVTHST
jgi:hypothetical protein